MYDIDKVISVSTGIFGLITLAIMVLLLVEARRK